MGYYVYRSTTEKLGADLDRIESSGDTIVQPTHVGGRDWIVVCRKGANRPADQFEEEALRRATAQGDGRRG